MPAADSSFADVSPADYEQFESAPVKTRVLLVDDQLIVAAAVSRMLQGAHDVELHAVQDPAQALDRALALRPTVILQDLVMPGSDGFDIVASYRAHPELRDTPVVVLSSTEDAATKARAFASGANDYLIKLPERAEFLARLRYHSAAHVHHRQRDLALGQLRRELDMARNMLLELLPAPGRQGNVCFEWVFRASSYVSGDCFDYFPLDENYLCFYVADVSGHGVSAAMLAFSVQHQIRAAGRNLAGLIAKNEGDIGRAAVQTVEGINRHFLQMRETNLFLTMFYGIVDQRSGETALVQAGHPPALRFAAPGPCCDTIGEGSVPIGFLAEPEYSVQRLRLQPGHRLYLYSDGVTDCRGPEEEAFSLERLTGVLRLNQHRPLAQGGEALLAALLAWQGSERAFDDDVTFLAIEFMPSPAPEA